MEQLLLKQSSRKRSHRLSEESETPIDAASTISRASIFGPGRKSLTELIAEGVSLRATNASFDF